MQTKLQKMNIYLLEKHNKVFVYFAFLIFSLAITYIYFLFMSVSYTYAEQKDSRLLNSMVTENVQKEGEIFDLVRENENKIISSNFVKIDNINYVKLSSVIVKLDR